VLLLLLMLVMRLRSIAPYLTAQSLNIASAGAPTDAVKGLLSKPFRPGQFFTDAAAAGVKFGLSKEEVINRIVTKSEQHFAGTA
jgi:hypothetical protein